MSTDQPLQNETHREYQLKQKDTSDRDRSYPGDVARLNDHEVVAFDTLCEESQPPTALEAGGYSIEEPRTRRALTEDMDVRFVQRGPVYDVLSESGSTYVVDVEKETCTCPDFEQRQPDGGCKHLRRVDLEIRTGLVPTPDGTFLR